MGTARGERRGYKVSKEDGAQRRNGEEQGREWVGGDIGFGENIFEGEIFLG
jgi:hypothetical protein